MEKDTIITLEDNTNYALLDETIIEGRKFFFAVKIDNYAIMPDHIHLLVTIGCDALPDDEQILEDDFFNKIKYADISDIIGCFKASVTRKIRKEYPQIKIWHRSYFDHIINNLNDYNATWDYIENNPNVWIAKQKENRIEN